PAVPAAQHRQHQPAHARGLHPEAAQVLPAAGPALPLVFRTRSHTIAMTTLATPLLTLALIAPAQSPAATQAAPGRSTVTTQVAPRPRLTVGDRFDVTLVVTSPPRSLVTGPLSDSLGVFVVGEEKRTSTTRSDGVRTTYRLSMAGFKPGTHRIPVFA